MKIASVLFLCIVLFYGNFHYARCQSESMNEKKQSKFREREASDDNLPLPTLDEDALLNTKCPQNVELRWQSEISSSSYATPLIADINSDGKTEIVVPSFVHYLEVLEGADGDKLLGWPVFHQSTVHSSPLLYDIDKDGVREITLATYNGEILFFRVSGYKMLEKLEVPRLKVRKDWFVGLETDHSDRSHPDVHDEDLVKEAIEKESLQRHVKNNNNDTFALSTGTVHNVSTNVSDHLFSNETSVNMTQHDGQINAASMASDKSASEFHNGTIANVSMHDHPGENETTEHHLINVGIATESTGNVNSSVTRRRLLEVSDNSNVNDTENIATVENEEDLEDAADSSFDLFRDGDDTLTEEYSYDYDDYVDEDAWGDEDWAETNHPKLEDFVNVDSHILCTPVIADIDKDGVDEMIVAASYFYDPEYYENPDHKKELGDIDISKYVAGAIVVFNLETKQVKWSTQLDLSRMFGSFRAFIYSSPTVVDLDGDGYLDILVGTSFGFFYVLDHHGKTREGFPLQMGEIQGQVIAADINDDGKIEIVTTDSRGNVAAWTPQGKEIWEIHLRSSIFQAPTVGDVDGDGHTDLVIPTISGNIYVINGRDGSYVKPFPYRTYGRIMSPVLLVDLSRRGDKRRVLTLAALSFDGYFYLIDGQTACADVVDIGETSYSMALAENVDGGDDLDFIITTMNGNVFCFSSPAPHHPLKSWTSQLQGRNNVAVRHNRQGIFILPSSRTFRDEEGENFWLQFKIVDQHRIPSGSHGPYNVTVTLLVPGNYQGPRRIVQSQIYDQPDTYKMKLPTVPVRTTGTVILEMVDKNGLHFSDEFSLSFHFHYFKLFKWLLVLPMLGMFGLLVILRPQEAAPLPSFSRNMHQL